MGAAQSTTVISATTTIPVSTTAASPLSLTTIFTGTVASSTSLTDTGSVSTTITQLYPTSIPTTLLTSTTSTIASVSSLTAPPSSYNFPTSSTALPKTTGAPQYIFTYGDSYSSTLFSLNGTKPSIHNPLGNPPYPGLGAMGVGVPNWVDLLTVNAPLNTLTYNWAYGGADVDNNLTAFATHVPDFLNQSSTFVTNLATGPRKAYAKWTAANSVHVIYFGRNDVYWQIVQNASMTTRINAVHLSYINALNALYAAGARRFVIMRMGPMWEEPVWSRFDFAPWNTGQPYVQPSTNYWNSHLTTVVNTWRAQKKGLRLSFLDTMPAFAMVLNNPAAWGSPDGACANVDPVSNGYDCPWADTVHPGPALQASIGIAVGQHLKSTGFLKGFALS